MTPPTTTRAYTPKYEPRSASATGSRPNMDASSAGNAARMSTSGRAPASTFAPASPDSSHRTRVLGHRIVGSSTRTTTSPKRTSRPHHANFVERFQRAVARVLDDEIRSKSTREILHRLSRSLPRRRSLVRLSHRRRRVHVQRVFARPSADVRERAPIRPRQRRRPARALQQRPEKRFDLRSLALYRRVRARRQRLPLSAHSTAKPRAPTARPRTRASSPSVMSW